MLDDSEFAPVALDDHARFTADERKPARQIILFGGLKEKAASSLRCCQREESRENFLAVSSEDRFWMKLHSVHRELAMTERHDFPIIGFCRNFQTCWEGASLHDQRMVSTGLEGRRQIGEQAVPGVRDHR